MTFTEPERLRVLPPYLFLEIDRKKREARARGADLIDLGVGDRDLPTPRPILEALHAAAEDPANHNYPFGRGRQDFRAAVAEWFQRRFGVALDPEQEILCLIGSKEGLGHAPLAWINPGDAVLVPDPAYPVYQAATVFAGGVPVRLPLTAARGYRPDLENLPPGARRAKLMFLNYPNNPTAACLDLAGLAEVVAWCRRHGVILAHDMAYSEIYFEGDPPPSVLQVPGAREVAVEFHSFSKTFSMTGWRIGFAVGRRELIDALARVKGNLDSGTVSAVQVAATAALRRDRELIEPIVAAYRRRRDLFVRGLQQAGWSVAPPRASLYVWCPVPGGGASAAYCERLLDSAGVLATPGAGFGAEGEGFLRFSLTSDDARLSEAVRRIQAAG